MAISSSDLLLKLSTKSGSAGNTLAQGDVNASLGKYISTTQVSATALNNLFDNVSGPENADSDVEYRCFFIHNNHASLTFQSPVVYISASVAGGTTVAIGVDTTAAKTVGSSSAQALEVADESTAPTGVSFSSPTTEATGLALGSIAAGYVKAIWVRRTAANTVAVDADGATLVIAGGTAA